ncbi:MAG: ABC transporter permease [Rhodobacterales bacterium]|nr:ABC transporter permease [Rhodobacterales bacterium]
MFRVETTRTPARTALGLAELIFHSAVRSIRKTHGNAIVGLAMQMLQAIMMIAIFYLMFALIGMKSTALRGDFLLYIMSGIFMFTTHIKAVGAVSRAEGPTSAMMKHAPMNTIVAIFAAALGALYLQFISAVVILFAYHVLWQPISVEYPVQTLGMFMLAWGTGCAVGMIFLAMKPFAPEVTGILNMLYQRGNMVASGKMFVANAMPTYILAYFDWNPLFHVIDQTRGFVFLNYAPRYSSISYPVIVMLVCLVLGLMGEFYARRHVSASWFAGK